MTYVMSDLHGMYGKYVEMSDKIGGLRDGDTLYVLGDVIDRGPDGVQILRKMMGNARIVPITGNHELLALQPLGAIADGETIDEIKDTPQYIRWIKNGGEQTATAFAALDRETRGELIDYLVTFTDYKELTIGGRSFHLSHTLPEYDLCGEGVHNVDYVDFIRGEPDYEIVYDPNVTFITGHTPTHLIDPAYKGRIWHGNGHIAIDCGATCGGRLGCLCLETMEEFYV